MTVTWTAILWTLFFLAVPLFANEDWLCTTQAAQMQGNLILTCGVGEAMHESGARARAFENAKAEFDRLCDAGTPCYEHQHSIEPGRTTCMRVSNWWKCYRLVTYTVLPETRVAQHVQPKPVVQQTATTPWYLTKENAEIDRETDKRALETIQFAREMDAIGRSYVYR